MTKAVKLARLFTARIGSFFFPRLCLCCEKGLPAKGKEYICFSCRADLPYTNFHKLPENPVIDKLAGRVPLVFGAAYVFFRPDTKAQQVIHALKYYNRPEIGRELGQIYGQELKTVGLLADLDYIVPVPLHAKRLHQRGYNQAEEFGKGLATSLGVELLPKGLVRKDFEASQTKKSRLERIKNVEDTFAAGKQHLNDKHVMLVDDVLTTGATLEACADALRETYPSVKLSLVVIGFVE